MTPLPTWMTSGVGRPSQTGAHSHTPADWVRPHPWSGSYWSQCWSVTPGHSPPPAGHGRPPPSPTTPVGTCPLSVGRAQNIGYYTDTGNMQSPILYTGKYMPSLYFLPFCLHFWAGEFQSLILFLFLNKTFSGWTQDRVSQAKTDRNNKGGNNPVFSTLSLNTLYMHCMYWFTGREWRPDI